jgi:hypothetical protein
VGRRCPPQALCPSLQRSALELELGVSPSPTQPAAGVGCRRASSSKRAFSSWGVGCAAEQAPGPVPRTLCPAGPLFGKLQKGIPVEVAGGRVVQPHEVRWAPAAQRSAKGGGGGAARGLLRWTRALHVAPGFALAHPTPNQTTLAIRHSPLPTPPLLQTRQVMEDAQPGPLVLIADCPSEAYLPGLAQAPALQQHMGQAAQPGKLQLLVHLAPLEVGARLPGRPFCSTGTSCRAPLHALGAAAMSAAVKCGVAAAATRLCRRVGWRFPPPSFPPRPSVPAKGGHRGLRTSCGTCCRCCAARRTSSGWPPVAPPGGTCYCPRGST